MVSKASGTFSQVALIALLLAAGAASVARVPQPEPLRVNVSVVTVGVRVIDVKGLEVPNLSADHFRVYEDGIEQQIALFSNEEQPISLGILLDRSDSMESADKFGRAKAAAQLLVDTCHPGSEYLYIPFDAYWSSGEFITDREQIGGIISGTKLGHGTRLYDAIIAALERSRRAKHGRQALVVITDGTDQHSSQTLDELVYAVQESQVQLYTIGYFSRIEDDLFRNKGPRIELINSQWIDNPRMVFKRLAEESGAEAFFPKSDIDLQSAVEKISQDLRTQYTLAYYPPNPSQEGKYRRIRVKLRAKGLTVRARQGYVIGNKMPR